MNKKMIKFGLSATALAASISLVACSSDSSSESSSTPSNDESTSYETFDDLPSCGKILADETAFVEEDDANYICNADEKEWAVVKPSKMKLDDCTKKTQDELAYAEASEEYYICKDGEWELLGEDDEEEEVKSSDSKDEEESSSSKADDVDEGDEDESSSSKADDGDDEDGDEQSSSSMDEEVEVKHEVVVKTDTIAGTVIRTDTLVLHQTVVIEETTYVAIEVPMKDENGDAIVQRELIATAPIKALSGEPQCQNAMFCGKQGDVQVETTVGKSNYGWWYTYTDDGDGGTTKITWPYGFDDDGSFVWPSVLNTAGLKAKVTFGNGYEYPYAGLGFDLVDANDSYADITDWDGMCVIYNTAQPLYLQVKPTDEQATTGYNNPMAVLPSSNSKNVIIDIDWSLFQQESGWGKEVTTASVLKKASKITFKLAGEAGTDNTFIIYAIGKKGTCEGDVVADTPVSEDSIDILSGAGEFSNGTGKLSAFTTYIYEYDDGRVAGDIETITNDNNERVLEFYNGEDNEEHWYLQLKKSINLNAGYSYQIFITGYDYDGEEEDFLNVSVGLQDPETYDNLIDDDGSNWATNVNEWKSGILNNCEDRTAQFYINGGLNKDDAFAIKSLKIIQTPISSCQ